MKAAVKMDRYSVMSELENNTKEVRAMVMDSYQDMLEGKGRDYKDFFQELESRYKNANVTIRIIKSISLWINGGIRYMCCGCCICL